eukprot:g30618.t1
MISIFALISTKYQSVGKKMVGEGGVFGVVNPFGWRLRNTTFSLFRSDMVLGTSCDAFWAVFVTTSQVFCKEG